MFFKIIKNNSIIVDATKIINYVRENPRNKALISCESILANGIVSSDGTTIWHLEGCSKFTKSNYDTVRVVEVCEDEYNAIIEKLGIGKTVTEEIRAKLSTTEMMEKIEQLTAEIENLKKQLSNK